MKSLLAILMVSMSLSSMAHAGEGIQCVRFSERVCTTSPVQVNSSTFRAQCKVYVAKRFFDQTMSEPEAIEGSAVRTNSDLNLFDLLTIGLTKAAEGLYNASQVEGEAQRDLNTKLVQYSLYPLCEGSPVTQKSDEK